MWWFTGHLLLDPSKETHGKDHGKQLRRGGKEEGKNKTENHKSQLHLLEDQQSPPWPQDHSCLPSTQWRSEGDPSHDPGEAVAKLFFLFLKAISPFLPLSPKLFVATAAAWLHSQTALGVAGEQAPWSLLCTPFPLPRAGIAGPSWGLLGHCPAPSPLHRTGHWGKHPALPQQCCRDTTSGLMSCLVEAHSSETSPKIQTLTLDNGDALEPIQFQALNISF